MPPLAASANPFWGSVPDLACTHTQRLLRATTAWRLRQVQRAGWTLLVVPFYELLPLPKEGA